MIKKIKFFALTLLLILCLITVCGCNKDDSNNLSEDMQQESQRDDVVGKVTFVYDKYFYLDTAKNEGKISDYAKFNTNIIVFDGYSERIFIDDNARFYIIKDKKVVDATKDDLESDQIVAVTRDKDDILEIYILKQGE